MKEVMLFFIKEIEAVKKISFFLKEISSVLDAVECTKIENVKSVCDTHPPCIIIASELSSLPQLMPVARKFRKNVMLVSSRLIVTANILRNRLEVYQVYGCVSNYENTKKNEAIRYFMKLSGVKSIMHMCLNPFGDLIKTYTSYKNFRPLILFMIRDSEYREKHMKAMRNAHSNSIIINCENVNEAMLMHSLIGFHAIISEPYFITKLEKFELYRIESFLLIRIGGSYLDKIYINKV